MVRNYELKRRAFTTAVRASETLMATVTGSLTAIQIVPKDTLTIWNDQLDTKMQRVNKAFDIVMDLAKTEIEVDENTNELDALEEHLVTVRNSIKNYINLHYALAPNPNPTNHITNLPAPVPNVQPMIKRKALEVPTFDGKRPEDWTSFWKTFGVQYGDDPTLNNEHKLLHLRNYLVGEALDDIRALEITAQNYTNAVARLNKKYGDKIILENRFLHSLTILPAVKDDRDYQGLQKLHRYVEINIENLNNIGVVLDEYKRTLFPALAAALPRGLIQEYDRTNNGERSVALLMSWLQEFVVKEAKYEMMTNPSNHSISTVKPNQPNNMKKGSDKKKKFEKRGKSNRESSLAVMSVTIKMCQFCNSKQHDRKICPLTPEERREKLKTKNICFKCLGRIPHKTDECRTKMKCYRCGGEHHTYLCIEREPAKENQEKISHSSAVIAKKEPEFEFLKVTMAKIHGKKESTTGVVFFDGGSQRTFIRSDIARKLQLKQVGSEKLNLEVFKQDPAAEVCRKVESAYNQQPTRPKQ
uniref:Peptidase aspartic putative domain-containing protein n=1 Tax=Strigamia maritima TaxID=126957 RepID=T1IUU9_STRMM